ncbi:hypothetical protein [Providencia manganoxydans]|uniref:hypothetical protein n=1 Tax=Providencia TaxID=586 RepID=UPI003F716CB6
MFKNLFLTKALSEVSSQLGTEIRLYSPFLNRVSIESSKDLQSTQDEQIAKLLPDTWF